MTRLGHLMLCERVRKIAEGRCGLSERCCHPLELCSREPSWEVFQEWQKVHCPGCWQYTEGELLHGSVG